MNLYSEDLSFKTNCHIQTTIRKQDPVEHSKRSNISQALELLPQHPWRTLNVIHFVFLEQVYKRVTNEVH